MSFTEILSVIGRSRSRSVNFRLVPNSLEAIIGKASIDELDTLPLVAIEYNIHKTTNRLVKRMFDIGLALVFMILLYPWKILSMIIAGKKEDQRSWILLLPKVLAGSLSFVGLPREEPADAHRDGIGLNGRASYLGPTGLTGLAQLYRRDRMEAEELESAKLYYARNQSLILDFEILLKSVLDKKRATTWQK